MKRHRDLGDHHSKRLVTKRDKPRPGLYPCCRHCLQDHRDSHPTPCSADCPEASPE